MLSWQGASQAKVGDQFKIVVYAQTGGKVVDVPLKVAYDSSALEVVDVAEGDFLKANNAQTVFSSNVDPSGGQVSVDISQPGLEGAAGRGSLAVLTFKVTAANPQAPISVSGSAVNAAGDTVQSQSACAAQGCAAAMKITRKYSSGGFTLIELVVTLAILAMLSTVALPMTEVAVQRGKEQELHAALRQIRDAIDAYKQAYDEGHITRKVGASGYPPTLDILVQGVSDAQSQKDNKLFFLRHLPRNPFARDINVPAAETWGKRSYASNADEPQEGDDVFDVYAPSPGIGLNGVPYKEW